VASRHNNSKITKIANVPFQQGHVKRRAVIHAASPNLPVLKVKVKAKATKSNATHHLLPHVHPLTPNVKLRWWKVTVATVKVTRIVGL
jgi:hypothetical protein